MASRTQWAAAAVVLAAVACGAPCREAVAKEEASKSTAKPAKSIDEQITFSNAIENGRIPEVEALLAQGFSVNDAQAYGFNAGDSPLMKAAQQGNAQLVAFLLRRGARVGYRTRATAKPHCSALPSLRAAAAPPTATPSTTAAHWRCCCRPVPPRMCLTTTGVYRCTLRVRTGSLPPCWLAVLTPMRPPTGRP